MGEEYLTVMLDEVFKIANTLSMMERGRKCDLLRVEGTEGPLQTFLLIIPINNTYSLLYVAEVRLRKVDLKFGDEIITGI